MAEKRRKFTAEFREGAVRIVTETGKPVPEVANDLGRVVHQHVRPCRAHDHLPAYRSVPALPSSLEESRCLGSP
ncbi:transposase [Streptomyces sp. NBC_01615]